MKIRMTKLNAFQKVPNRAHYNDAGADVFTLTDVVVNPNETIKIPLGIILEIPDGYMGCIFPKSGLASKGIIAQLPPIDSGYRGEIHAIVSNISQDTFKFNKYDKVGQLVILPIIIPELVANLDDTRGTGAFGSTGV